MASLTNIAITGMCDYYINIWMINIYNKLLPK